MNHFVTAGDFAYLFRSITLIESFLKQNSQGKILFYANDKEAGPAMKEINIPGLTVVCFEEYATHAWTSLQGKRSTAEFCQTGKPIALQHAMQTAAEGDWIIWLDGDMMFFQPAEKILPINDCSMFFTPHHYTASFASFESSVGRINSGLVGFKKNEEGQTALNWWADLCLDWCGSIPEENRYTDQKYLDDARNRYNSVCELNTIGVNAAPWNTLEREVSSREGNIYIGNDVLIIFHFQGLKIINRNFFNLYPPPMRISKEAKKLIYDPYSKAMRSTIKRVTTALPNYNKGFTPFTWPQRLRRLKRIILGQDNFIFVD